MSDTPEVPEGSSGTVLNPDFLKGFSIDATEYAFLAEHPEAFVPSGRTTRFPFGEKVPFLGSLNGQPIEAFATFHGARMKRLTVMEQTRQDGDPYLIVQTLMNPVRVEFGVIVKDEHNVDQPISVAQLLYQIFRTSLSPGTVVTFDRFSDQLDAINMNLGGQQILLTHHFGADPEATQNLLDRFADAGAVDVISGIADPRRMKNVFQHPGSAEDLPEVTYMEIGRADREQSRTGQGFLDFIDSAYENFHRAVVLRATASGLRQQLETDKALPERDRRKLTIDQREAITQSVADFMANARTWANNASGVQQRIVPDPISGDLTPQDLWDPQYAPMGRWTVMFGSEEYPVDLWKTGGTPLAAGETINAATTPVVDTTTTAAETTPEVGAEKEPF